MRLLVVTLICGSPALATAETAAPALAEPMPAAQPPARPSISVRPGIGQFFISGSDHAPEEWAPGIDIAAEWRRVMLHAAIRRFGHEQLDDFDGGPSRYTYTIFEAGIRRAWHPSSRVTIAAGGGVLVQHGQGSESGSYTDTVPMIDLLVSVDLMRADRVAVGAFTQLTAGSVVNLARFKLGLLYGLGLSFRL